MSGAIAVLYGKVVDDKELGVYLDDVYFGGVAGNTEEADEIARDCMNNVRGGTAVVKTLQIEDGNSLLEVFAEARARFDRMEREMVETEAILERNQQRTKSRRK